MGGKMRWVQAIIPVMALLAMRAVPALASSSVAPSPVSSSKISLNQGVPALVGVNGAPATLTAYRGHVVLLNFWATWCGPCREEMPELNRLDAGLDHRKYAVVGIAADELADVQAFLQKLKVQYPILVGAPDPLYAWSATLGNRAMGLPFSVLLDRGGVVRWTKSGGKLTQAEVWTEMQKLK